MDVAEPGAPGHGLATPSTCTAQLPVQPQDNSWRKAVQANVADQGDDVGPRQAGAQLLNVEALPFGGLPPTIR